MGDKGRAQDVMDYPKMGQPKDKDKKTNVEMFEFLNLLQSYV